MQNNANAPRQVMFLLLLVAVIAAVLFLGQGELEKYPPQFRGSWKAKEKLWADLNFNYDGTGFYSEDNKRISGFDWEALTPKIIVIWEGGMQIGDCELKDDQLLFRLEETADEPLVYSRQVVQEPDEGQEVVISSESKGGYADG